MVFWAGLTGLSGGLFRGFDGGRGRGLILFGIGDSGLRLSFESWTWGAVLVGNTEWAGAGNLRSCP